VLSDQLVDYRHHKTNDQIYTQHELTTTFSNPRTQYYQKIKSQSSQYLPQSSQFQQQLSQFQPQSYTNYLKTTFPRYDSFTDQTQ
jgi:hypothetical protein